jgi:hypothetical protein
MDTTDIMDIMDIMTKDIMEDIMEDITALEPYISVLGVLI